MIFPSTIIAVPSTTCRHHPNTLHHCLRRLLPFPYHDLHHPRSPPGRCKNTCSNPFWQHNQAALTHFVVVIGIVSEEIQTNGGKRSDVWGHLFGTFLDKGFKRLEAKLAELIVVDIDELDQRRNDSLHVLPEAMACLATA